MKFIDIYNNLNKLVFFICLGVTIVLMVVSFAMPPKGVIHPSVIAASGELFGFATLGSVVIAIERGRNISISKGDTSVTIDDEESN